MSGSPLQDEIGGTLDGAYDNLMALERGRAVHHTTQPYREALK